MFHQEEVLTKTASGWVTQEVSTADTVLVENTLKEQPGKIRYILIMYSLCIFLVNEGATKKLWAHYLVGDVPAWPGEWILGVELSRGVPKQAANKSLTVANEDHLPPLSTRKPPLHWPIFWGGLCTTIFVTVRLHTTKGIRTRREHVCLPTGSRVGQAVSEKTYCSLKTSFHCWFISMSNTLITQAVDFMLTSKWLINALINGLTQH